MHERAGVEIMTLSGKMTIQIPDDLARGLEGIAAEQRKSVEQVAVESLRRLLDQASSPEAVLRYIRGLLIPAPRRSTIWKRRLVPRACQCAIKAPLTNGVRGDLSARLKRDRRSDEGGFPNWRIGWLGLRRMIALSPAQSFGEKCFSGSHDYPQADGARSWRKPVTNF